jgi:hypothetical protein
MNNDKPLEAFQAAYDRAELELQKIHDEFERLIVRHDQVARVVEVLKPEAHMNGHVEAAKVKLTTRMAGLAVRTQLTVLKQPPKA